MWIGRWSTIETSSGCERRYGAQLPVRPGAARSQTTDFVTQTTRNGVPSGQLLKGRTVLVVEDHDDMRDLISQYLESDGAQVIGAANGARAREALAHSVVHLIVTDIAMPTESGIEMMERIRSAGWLREIPAIAISGEIRTEELVRFRPSLFQAVLAKPFDPARLVVIARDLVG